MTLESQVIAMSFAASFLQILITLRRNANERSKSVDDQAMFAEKAPTAGTERGSLAE